MMEPSNKAGIFLVVMLVMIAIVAVVPPWHYGDPLGIDAEKAMRDAGKIDGMYEATATILGLVGFGSIIGIRFSTNKEQFGIQKGGLLLVGGCNVLVILLQTLTMIGVCCAGLPMIVYGLYVMLTGITLMGMVFGYVMMAKAQLDEAGHRHTRGYSIDDVTGSPEQ